MTFAISALPRNSRASRRPSCLSLRLDILAPVHDLAPDDRERRSSGQLPTGERRVAALRRETVRIDGPRFLEIDRREIRRRTLFESAPGQIQTARWPFGQAADRLFERQDALAHQLEHQ